MRELIILGILLTINLIGTLIFIYKTKDKREKWIAMFFLILPFFGFALYFFMKLAVKIYEQDAYYDRETLVANLEMPDEVKKPNSEDELSVVAITDALTVSTNKEKRTLILNQLKKEDDSSYKSLLVASRDEDSETAHYVATAKVSAYEKTYDVLRKTKSEYEKNSTKNNLLNLLKSTSEIIGSGVLSNAEKKLYYIEYCNLIEQDKEEQQIPNEYFDDYVDYLIQLDRKEDLMCFWQNFQPKCVSEFVYFKMLEFFYQNKDNQNFFATLNQIKQSNIFLSSKGLNKLRFWMKLGEN